MTTITWTYLSLTAALSNFLDDADPDWNNTTTINQLIQLGEQKLVEDLDLTVFDLAATVSLIAGTSGNVVARPANIMVTDDLFYQLPTGPSAGKNLPLERRDYAFVLDYLDPAVSGPPLYYAEQDATNYIIAPYADQAYTLNSFGVYAHQSLVDIQNPGTATTWLSANAGACLLEACLMEAAKFLKNEGKRKVQEMVYGQKLATLKVRFRALRRNTLEDPRATGGQAAEGQLPASAPAPGMPGNVLTRQ